MIYISQTLSWRPISHADMKAPPVRNTLSGRQISYAAAILEATDQAMEISPDVIVLGQLSDLPSGIFGTTTGLVEKYGRQRVHDFPVAENLMTAVALGSSLTGLRPLVVHQRLDFMMYSMDVIVNWLSLWYFKSNSSSNVPVTIRCIVGKGWGQGPQHSKSLHAWFAHLPGLRVAVPATAFDAKGLLLESLLSDSPAIFIEGRNLYSMTDRVPEEPYRVPFGRAIVRRSGTDITLVAIGNMVPLALRAAESLSMEGVEVEVVDPRTLSPLDRETICNSVAKTGRLVVVDPAWQSFGASAEIMAAVSETVGLELKANPARVTLPDSHTPMSMVLEAQYYPSDIVIATAIRNNMRAPRVMSAD